MTTPVLEVRELTKYFPVRAGVFLRKVGDVHAVDDVSLQVHRGETLGLVGESGCGKSTVGRVILNLLRPTRGRVFFEGRDLSGLSRSQWQAVRREMQIIFQDPMESLNARHTVGRILEEPFVIHRLGTPVERRGWAQALLERVGLPSDSISRFPHEFSGGQRQRIGIARAIALQPKLIICDEAVSALDVSVRAQIINLLLELQRDMDLALLFIAHDLSVVRHVSDRVAVMYLGQIVEQAPSRAIYERPGHPYTRALVSAIPIPDPERRRARIVLEGDVPSPISPPSGCRFHTRCAYAVERCRREPPSAETPSRAHQLSCHRWRELPAPAA
ncbi:MAG: ATP-binding cassette domain-containing protein [Rhodospirillaceae bacterium]|nr:ATP-binding cassette domain-containing protein [Rhodospirillaceae bacterium]